eukprot:2742406-Rhodomonas_salina.1
MTSKVCTVAVTVTIISDASPRLSANRTASLSVATASNSRLARAGGEPNLDWERRELWPYYFGGCGLEMGRGGVEVELDA